MFGGFVMLSLAPCSMQLSRRWRFSPSHSTTMGVCEGAPVISSISRSRASPFPLVLADRKSRRTTSAHLCTSDRRSISRSLHARVKNPSPKARAMASPKPESWLKKETCMMGLSNELAPSLRQTVQMPQVPDELMPSPAETGRLCQVSSTCYRQVSVLGDYYL